MENQEKQGKNNKRSKTRVLAVGDIHGDTGLVKKLAEKAQEENIDLVVFAGDITMGEQSIKGLIGPFARINKPVLIVPGNHESIATIDFLDKAYDNAKNIHGYGFEFNGLGVFGAGTANMGIHQIPDEEIFEMLEKGHDSIKSLKKKLMVTHIHPKRGKSERFFGWEGSEAVRKAIETFKPQIAVNAHLHSARGMEEKIAKTRVVNVSRKPTIFEI